MTQDKMRKLITAAVVAGTALLAFLFAFLVYQWITIAVYDNRIKKAQDEIAYYEKLNETAESDLEGYLSDDYRYWEALELGLIQNKGN